MPIYFVRHGESTHNASNLFTGRANPALTKKGEYQALKTAEELKALGEKISYIVSSPLTRAVRTAEIIAGSIGYEKPIKTDQRIIEYDIGELESTIWRKLSKEEFSTIKGAEPPEEFRARLIDFLDEYKHRSNILVVGHGGVYRMIESARLGLDPASFHEVDRPKNASYIELNLNWIK